MSRSRLIPLGLLAALIVSGVATASASEPPDKCGGKVSTTPTYCIEGLQVENSKGEEASEKVEGANGEAILKATVASAEAEIKCGKGTSKGTIEDGISGVIGKSTATITYTECKVTKPAGCELGVSEHSQIKTEPLAGELVMSSGGRIEDKLKSKSSVFAAVAIEGEEGAKCDISAIGEEKRFNISGTQTCEVDKSNTEAEKEAKEHKLICKTSGSALELGENEAEMTGEGSIELSGAKAHDNWSIKEHV